MEDSQEDEYIVNYFSTLFSSTTENVSMDFLEGLGRRVTTMGEELVWDFSEDEIKVALRQMHPIKAPRSNGMPPLFYQHYWHIVGPFIIITLIQTLNSDQFPTKLNHTFITLILKKKQPSYVAEYHPISLCNVL